MNEANQQISEQMCPTDKAKNNSNSFDPQKKFFFNCDGEKGSGFE